MLYILALLIITIFGWFGFLMVVDVFEAFWFGEFKKAIWPSIGFAAVVGCFVISMRSR